MQNSLHPLSTSSTTARHLLDSIVQGKITESDVPTTCLDATPSGPSVPLPPSSPTLYWTPFPSQPSQFILAWNRHETCWLAYPVACYDKAINILKGWTTIINNFLYFKSQHFPSSNLLNTNKTHTHTFNGPFPGTTWLSRYQKGTTNLDFTEARDSEWQWHQLGHMQVCTSLQTNNHASTSLSFLQARCLSCR